MKLFLFQSDNLDEIVFVDRTKKYGAYELRKSYDSRVIKSFLFALLLLAFLSGAPVLLLHLFKKNNPEPELYTMINIDLKKNFEIEQEKKKSAPSIAPPLQKISANAPFKVLSDSLVSKEDIKKDSIQAVAGLTASTTANTSETTTLDTTGTDQVKKGDGNTPEPFASATVFNLAVLEKAPQFPGGELSLMVFFRNNIHYNTLAREEKISGRVYASFIINSKGKVEAIKIIRSLGYGLDEEVLRVLNEMPDWEPGFYEGKPVSTIMNIPVSFNILQ